MSPSNQISVMPDDYSSMLADLKTQVRAAQLRAHMTVNTELIHLYWSIGRTILERQAGEGWGAKVIERLAADLRAEFPDMTGLSRTNLSYMQQFAAAHPDGIVQQAVGRIPWGHITVLLGKVSERSVRDWYAAKTLENCWSRNVLLNQIKGQAHLRFGAAPSNFADVLPAMDSDLAQQITKDPYVFDFLAHDERRSERDVENQLVANVERTLRELGRGFSFVGRQHRLEVGGDEFFVDLLFFNYVQLRFVVVELKVGTFDPGHLGQLQFYVAVVDGQLRDPAKHLPTVGFLLCATKNDAVVQYALGGTRKPLAVSQYTYDSLPEDAKGALPAPREVTEPLDLDAHLQVLRNHLG